MPTDMMSRRTPLPLRGHFSLFGITVAITTNYEAILRAAGNLCFVPLVDTDETPAAIWEVVGTPVKPPVRDWECSVTLGDHALYMGMGPEQWFAFDLDTYDAAGFVFVHDSDHESDLNAERYLSTIAFNVGVRLRTELENGCGD